MQLNFIIERWSGTKKNTRFTSIKTRPGLIFQRTAIDEKSDEMCPRQAIRRRRRQTGRFNKIQINHNANHFK